MSSFALASDLARLDDSALLASMNELARRERVLLATVITHLMAVDDRALYLGPGFPSLFEYCTRGLGWSASCAWKRTQAVLHCRRLPVLLAAVEAGNVHLSALSILGPHLTAENADATLAAARGKGKRELELIVHALRPTPPAPVAPIEPQVGFDFSSAAALRAAGATPSREVSDLSTSPGKEGAQPPREVSDLSTSPGKGAGSQVADLTAVPGATGPVPPTRPGPPRVPTVALRSTPKLLAMLERARGLLAHALPGCDEATVVEEALGLLIRTVEKRRFGAGKPRKSVPARPKRARPSPPTPPTTAPNAEAAVVPVDVPPVLTEGPVHRDAVPKEVAHAVYVRDEGRCTFRGPDGRRCCSTWKLELHHIDPWCNGGGETVENLTLHCRQHNQYEAERQGLHRPTTKRG